MRLLNKIKSNLLISILFVFDFSILILALIFYYLIPNILNYLKGHTTQNYSGITYSGQFLLIILLTIILSNFVLFILIRDILGWEKYLEENNIKKINKTIRNCINLPYMIYIVEAFFPALMLGILYVNIKMPFLLGAATIILVFTFCTLAAVINLIFSKNLFRSILINLNNHKLLGLRINLNRKLFLQIIPILMVALLFTSLLGYTRYLNDMGNDIFKYYRIQMEKNFKNNIHSTVEIKKRLSEIPKINSKDTWFFIDINKNIYSERNTPLSKYFLFTIYNLAGKNKGKVSDYPPGQIQGAVLKVIINNKKWIVGMRFVVSTWELEFFLLNFFVLLILNIIVLNYLSKSISTDISSVSTSLIALVEGESSNLNAKLFVTSNDEIGDLVTAFNKLQEREKENIKTIEQKQKILTENERLASLGQMIGGIAHNLNSPIMSIAGGIEALKDLVTEYKESVNDINVNKDDHLEIAKEMESWLNDMKPYCAYMSDVLSTVKGQAVQLNASLSSSFTLDELLKRIEILTKFELNKFGCAINYDCKADANIEIRGEISNLVQVFNNLISNAIQSYEGKGGIIKLKIAMKDAHVEFAVRDYGVGIPEDIQQKIFKEMVTTKGTMGNGLGLYMSYATIKGRFGGDLWFESEYGKGTTFYISIPTRES